jgi:acyl-CoA thioesterase FadM
MRVPYSAVFRTNAQVQGLLKQVGDQGLAVPQSIETLMKAITIAASEAQMAGWPARSGKPVKLRKKSRPWFSRESGQLFRELKRLRKQNPANSSMVKEAKAHYKKQVRRDKKAAIGRRISDLRQKLVHDPGAFWKTVGKKGSRPDVHSLSAWKKKDTHRA